MRTHTGLQYTTVSHLSPSLLVSLNPFSVFLPRALSHTEEGMKVSEEISLSNYSPMLSPARCNFPGFLAEDACEGNAEDDRDKTRYGDAGAKEGKASDDLACLSEMSGEIAQGLSALEFDGQHGGECVEGEGGGAGDVGPGGG